LAIFAKEMNSDLQISTKRKPDMEKQESFEFKPWMWIALLVAFLLIVFNFDPVGDVLEKVFGQGADKWATNILLIILVIYVFIKKK